jgi:hypothetical protein
MGANRQFCTVKMVDRGLWTVDKIISQTGDDPQSNTLEPEGVDPRTLAPIIITLSRWRLKVAVLFWAPTLGRAMTTVSCRHLLDHSLKSAFLSGFGMIATVFGLLPMADPNVIDIWGPARFIQPSN